MLKKYIQDDDKISKKAISLLKEIDLKNLEKFKLQDLRVFSKLINRKIQAKYKRKNDFYNKKKGINKNQFGLFIENIDDEKYKLLFSLMYKLGLRVGEVVKIKFFDIDLQNFQMKIRNEKCKRIDELIIPISLRKQILDYLNKNKFEILKNDNYIFYKISTNYKCRFKHISQDYVRNYFRKISIKCGINKPRVTTRKDNKERNLYEYGTHSFRRGFCNNFYALTRDPKKTQMVMRHKQISTTMDVYLEIEKKEVFGILENT